MFLQVPSFEHKVQKYILFREYDQDHFQNNDSLPLGRL